MPDSPNLMQGAPRFNEARGRLNPEFNLQNPSQPTPEPNLQAWFEKWVDLQTKVLTPGQSGGDYAAAMKALRDYESEVPANIINDFRVGYSRQLSDATGQQVDPKALENAKPGDEQFKSLTSHMNRMTDAQANQFKQQATLGLMTSAAKMGAGVIQAIDAAARLRKLPNPKYPQLLDKNPQLAGELNTALREAYQDDTLARSGMERAAAEGQQITRATAQQAGAGRATSLMQAGATQRTDALRQAEMNLMQAGDQRKQRLDNLIGRSMQEDQQQFQASVDKYRSDLMRRQQSQQQLSAQFNAGVQNVFGAMDDAVAYRGMQGYANSLMGSPQGQQQQGAQPQTEPMQATEKLPSLMKPLEQDFSKYAPSKVPLPDKAPRGAGQGLGMGGRGTNLMMGTSRGVESGKPKKARKRYDDQLYNQ